jgi:hypothetical protein
MAGEAIRFNASLNTAGFDSGAKNLQNIAASASAGITRHFGKIATAVVGIGAAFLGIRAASQAFNAAIAMGGQLNDLSARTGETAGNLAILQRAFENAGAGADSVGPTINRLQRAIVEAGQGGKEQAEAFAKLGINLAEIKNLTPTEQLQTIAKALQNVGNDSDRTAIAMQLLGRSGGELIPLLRAMGVELDVARGQLGSTPAVMDRVAGALDTLGDNFNAIGQKGKEFAAGLLERAAPALVEITNRIANIDAAGLGAKLSDYAVRTGQWMSETLKLNEALKNIEIAVRGITSGNFGEGFSLMFMTARDTAFSAINQIVAAGMAALGTISDALRQLFDPGSTTMAFIAGSFNMLGAKLAAGIFDSLATVLEKIPFMGAATEAVRGAKAEAEQAATDIANIMYYEAENLKSEWAGILAEAPKAFADSYAANMKDPLIDMTERTKETAAQAEKVAAATRAAAFNAQTFAENMASARSAMLEGGDISPFGTSPGMGQNDKGFKFPWQGSGPSGPKIDLPATAPDGRGAKADKPTTALDTLRKAAETDARARADLFRIEADKTRRTERVSELMDGRFFSSAANTQLRAERDAERRAQDLLTRRSATDALFGADSPLKNMGELQQRFRQENPFGKREDFDRFVRDQQKTPGERLREEESARNAEGGKSQAAQVALASEASLQSLIKEIRDRLPQNALVT